MTSPRWRADAQDDFLDEAIRSSLQERVSRAEPPLDAWPRLRSQVRAGPARRRRPVGEDFRLLMNALVQGAAAMIVIALLGVAVTINRPAEVAPLPSPTPAVGLATAETATPPLYVPADMPRHQIVRTVPVTAPLYLPARGDTLNMAQLIKIEPPRAQFNPAMLPVFNPRLDPTLNFYPS